MGKYQARVSVCVYSVGHDQAAPTLIWAYLFVRTVIEITDVIVQWDNLHPLLSI